MGEPELRWTEAPQFHWTPDTPYVAPSVCDDDDIAPTPQPANSAPSYLLTRLLVGALQGAGLMLLASGPSDSMLASALAMVLLFAPLLLLAGFGRVPGKLLLPWTAIAGIGLAALGAYQYWRGTAEVTGAAVALAAIALFIGQTLVMAWARDGEPLASYPAFHNSAWSGAVQVLLCALGAVVVGVVAGAAGNLLRPHYPGAHMRLAVTPIVTLAVALMSWLLSPPVLRRIADGLLVCWALALPVLALFAAAVAVAAMLLYWQPPLALDMALAASLLLAINASYRGGEARPRWRESFEFAATAGLTALAVLGALSLQSRVAQFGWTSLRIFAAAGLGVLGAYAIAYLVSALASLGGGGWMQRIERANLAMAVAVLALILALASPFADPARLSAQNQLRRVESAQVTPQAFDFHYLRSGSARFGQDALTRLALFQSAPEVARGAFLALTAEPAAAQPTPTRIGANIEVRSGHARLPADLLAHDWSKVAGAGIPPCLTSAALACDAYFTDLDGDGRDEIVLVYGSDVAWWAGVMKQGAQGWYAAGTLASSCRGTFDALRAGRFAPVAPRSGWQDLLAGGERLAVTRSEPAKSAGCSR